MSITIIIVIATVIVSYMCLNDSQLSYKLTLSPYSVKHQNKWWQLFTHGMVHADYGHLAMNMFTLYFLGTAVESMMKIHFEEKGLFYYILMYAGGLVFASLPSIIKHKDNPSYLAVGASGAVSAVVFAFILFRPVDMLLIYGIIPIPGIILGILYVAFESYAAKNRQTNIAHDAHLAGAAFGVVFLILLDLDILLSFIYQIKDSITG